MDLLNQPQAGAGMQMYPLTIRRPFHKFLGHVHDFGVVINAV